MQKLIILAALAGSVLVTSCGGSQWREFQNKSYYIGKGVPASCYNLNYGHAEYKEDATNPQEWWTAGITQNKYESCLTAESRIDIETRQYLEARQDQAFRNLQNYLQSWNESQANRQRQTLMYCYDQGRAGLGGATWGGSCAGVSY